MEGGDGGFEDGGVEGPDEPLELDELPLDPEVEVEVPEEPDEAEVEVPLESEDAAEEAPKGPD